MKLFKLYLGTTEYFGVAKDAEEMMKKAPEIDATFAYTPVVIEEVTVSGYEITVKVDKKSKD